MTYLLHKGTIMTYLLHNETWSASLYRWYIDLSSILTCRSSNNTAYIIRESSRTYQKCFKSSLYPSMSPWDNGIWKFPMNIGVVCRKLLRCIFDGTKLILPTPTTLSPRNELCTQRDGKEVLMKWTQRSLICTLVFNEFRNI